MRDAPAPVQALFQRIQNLERLFVERMTEQAQRQGLSVAQVNLLRDVAEHPETSLHDVCQRLGSPKSSISRLVDELVRQGKMLRTVPDCDRRSVRLSVPEGDHCIDLDWPRLFPGAPDEHDAAAWSRLVQAAESLTSTLDGTSH